MRCHGKWSLGLSQSPVASDLINRAYVTEPPQDPEQGGLESFWGAECIHMLGWWLMPNSMGPEAPVLCGPFQIDPYVPIHTATHLYLL